MSTSLILHFRSTPLVELYKTCFCHPLVSENCEIIAQRHRWNFSDDRNFQWSTAVKALSELIIGTLINPSFEISGGAKSRALSLDYAFSKKPDWIKSIFGIDRHGQLIGTRFITRENSGIKNGDTVKIKLSKFAQSLEIKIFLDQVEISKDLDALDKLLNQIIDTDSSKIKNILSDSIKELADLSFSNASILVGYGFNTLSKSFSNSAFLHKAAGNKLNQTLEKISFNYKKIPLNLDASRTDNLLKETPLTVSCAISSVESMLVFFYLKEIRKLPLNIDYRHSYAIKLAQFIASSNDALLPDLFVLGFVPGYTYHKRGNVKNYDPMCFLPTAKHFIIGYTERVKQWEFICEEPSTSALFADELGIPSNLCKHKEPNELLESFAIDNKKDTARITFSLFAKLTEKTLSAPSVELPAFYSSQYSIAYCRKDLSEKTKIALQNEINNAWITLTYNKNLRDQLIEKISTYREFLKFSFEATGAYKYV